MKSKFLNSLFILVLFFTATFIFLVSSVDAKTSNVPSTDNNERVYTLDYIKSHLTGNFSITYTLNDGKTTWENLMIRTSEGFYIEGGLNKGSLFIREGTTYSLYERGANGKFKLARSGWSQEDYTEFTYMMLYNDNFIPTNGLLKSTKQNGSYLVLGNPCEKFTYHENYTHPIDNSTRETTINHYMDPSTGVIMQHDSVFILNGKVYQKFHMECIGFTKGTGVQLPKLVK